MQSIVAGEESIQTSCSRNDGVSCGCKHYSFRRADKFRIDLPPNIVNPLQSYADIENQITGNWPSREHMIRAEGADPARFKRILGLTWAHAKPRRGARTVDLEEEYHKVDGEEEEDNSTVLDNIKKSLS